MPCSSDDFPGRSFTCHHHVCDPCHLFGLCGHHDGDHRGQTVGHHGLHVAGHEFLPSWNILYDNNGNYGSMILWMMSDEGIIGWLDDWMNGWQGWIFVKNVIFLPLSPFQEQWKFPLFFHIFFTFSPLYSSFFLTYRHIFSPTSK